MLNQLLPQVGGTDRYFLILPLLAQSMTAGWDHRHFITALGSSVAAFLAGCQSNTDQTATEEIKMMTKTGFSLSINTDFEFSK